MSLLSLLRVRLAQGQQAIPDLRAATPASFRGRPRVAPGACPEGCRACIEACPTPVAAIATAPVTIDLGRCILCAECAAACPEQKLSFSAQPRMAATSREALRISADTDEAATAVRISDTFHRLFGRSLRLRQVSAGGCNACELELAATANVNFDLGRYGIEWVASPRHADALVISGTITRTMADAVRACWQAMPEPRFLIAAGACAISGGLYEGAAGVDRRFFEEEEPALYVPGCPIHPLTFAHAILDFLGVK